MNSLEVVAFLQRLGINFIYHANSVCTANTQLKLGGLASRAYVEQNRLPQSSQITDSLDKILGVWNDIFTDSVDIHNRIRDRNKYGPVLFKLDVNILTNIPTGSRILITKSNPSKWKNETSFSDRYFTNLHELQSQFSPGNFDQMITISHCNILPFNNYLNGILLDDPINSLNPSQIFNNAQTKLMNGVSLRVAISRRPCQNACKCFKSYESPPTRIPYFF